MRCVFLANGRVGAEILQRLAAAGQRPTGLVVHPPERARDREAIVAATGLPPSRVLEGHRLNSPAGKQWLSDLHPDWVISISFGYLLSASVLAIPTLGALNLHPALLPFNRGSYPNVWSIVDRTPAGVTLHFMDERIDTGDLVAQARVSIAPIDTGASLYRKLEDASIELFLNQWPLIEAGAVQRWPQAGGGTIHRKADVEALDRIEPDRMYRAQELIDLLRARSFPPHRGAYLDLRDRKVYLRLELSEERREQGK